MRPVQKLIHEAAAVRSFTLQGAALSDMRAVLAANAKQPNRLKRVSMGQFLEYLRDTHGITVSTSAFQDYLHREHGKGWSL